LLVLDLFILMWTLFHTTMSRQHIRGEVDSMHKVIVALFLFRPQLGYGLPFRLAAHRWRRWTPCCVWSEGWGGGEEKNKHGFSGWCVCFLARPPALVTPDDTKKMSARYWRSIPISASCHALYTD
jgi:hypothetical protein